MRSLGLLNPRVQEDHAAYGIPPNPRHVDLPYPGVFLLDEQGRVAVKRFHESYRERDTGAGLVDATLGASAPGVSTVEGGPAVEGADEAVRVRAWLDSPTYCLFQRVHLNVEIAVTEGFHVYGKPVPDGYTPLSVDVAPIAGMERGAIAWPAPRRFTIEGLPEEFWVHEGTIRAVAPPDLHGRARSRRSWDPGHGTVPGVQPVGQPAAVGAALRVSPCGSRPRRPRAARESQVRAGVARTGLPGGIGRFAPVAARRSAERVAFARRR